VARLRGNNFRGQISKNARFFGFGCSGSDGLLVGIFVDAGEAVGEWVGFFCSTEMQISTKVFGLACSVLDGYWWGMGAVVSGQQVEFFGGFRGCRITFLY
jgi:hypothetical protein